MASNKDERREEAKKRGSHPFELPLWEWSREEGQGRMNHRCRSHVSSSHHL